jgi:2,3-dihydroxybenzoate decarboxylase
MKDDKEKTTLSRRSFLGRAGLLALALPGLLYAKEPAAGKEPGEAQAPSATGRAPAAKPYRISVETHAGTAIEADMFKRFAARSGFTASLKMDEGPGALALRRMGDIDQFRLPAMDASSIRMQVLSSGMGMQSIPLASAAIGFAKKVNDAQAETIRKHPGRFAGFASLPTQDPKAAADELERTVTKLGFKGATIQGHTNGEYLDAKKYWVLWERAADLGVPIGLHPMEPPATLKKYFEGHPELSGAAWVWGVDTATHALRIIGSGVFDQFPKAIVLLGHLGESLPYLLGRLDEGTANTFNTVKLKKRFSEYLRENFIISTSGKYRPEALICAVSAMGVDRVLYADDYPFVSMQEAVDLLENTPLTAEDKEKIYHLNAERWLKL